MRRVLLPLAFVLAGPLPAADDSPLPGTAEVSRVHFRLVRPDQGAPVDWLEVDVEVFARPSHESPGRMIPRVKIVAVLAFEVPVAGKPNRTEFYRASAEAVALGAGRSHVRFYLPPEMVRRDVARGEPRHWRAEALIDGRSQPVARAKFSSSLSTSESRRNFVQVADAAAAVNDGILQPQYLTPFATQYAHATPTFIRRDPDR